MFFYIKSSDEAIDVLREEIRRVTRQYFEMEVEAKSSEGSFRRGHLHGLRFGLNLVYSLRKTEREREGGENERGSSRRRAGRYVGDANADSDSALPSG